MFDSGGRVYRAFVKSSDFLTGEIIVTIPNLFGEEDGLSISYIGRQSYFNDTVGMYTWKVPLVGTVIAVASDDDQFSNLIWVDTDHESWDIQHAKNLALNPTGAILPYAGDANSIPVGYFLCDGGAFDGVVHLALANIVGDKYGTHIGDNYYLPNLKGKVVVGLDSSQPAFKELGKTGGSSTHLLTTTEMPSHTHTQDQHTHVQNEHTHTQNQHTHTQNEHTHTQNAHNHLVWIDTNSKGGHDHDYSSTNPAGSVLRGLSSPTASTGPSTSYTTNTTTSAGSHFHTIFGYSVDQTATNQNTTATNQYTTATNQNTTPTNQNTTATNQSTGGGEAHNNLQPYIVLNYIIKY